METAGNKLEIYCETSFWSHPNYHTGILRVAKEGILSTSRPPLARTVASPPTSE